MLMHVDVVMCVPRPHVGSKTVAEGGSVPQGKNSISLPGPDTPHLHLVLPRKGIIDTIYYDDRKMNLLYYI